MFYIKNIYLLFFFAVFCLSINLVSCSPNPIQGLNLVTIDGQSIPVLGKANSAPVAIQANKLEKFYFEQPLRISKGNNFVLLLNGYGNFEVKFLYKNTELYKAVVNIEINNRDIGLCVPIPTDIDVDAVTLNLLSGDSLMLAGFAVQPAFVGFFTAHDRLFFDTSTRLTIVDNSFNVSLNIPQLNKASLVVSAAKDADITVYNPASARDKLFTASIKEATQLAIPKIYFTDRKSITISANNDIDYAYFTPNDDAILADIYTILAISEPIKEDYILYRWDLFPDTLVLDFASYDLQDRYFKRLAFFAEKPDFRGSIAEDEKIASLHGWNAHDYKPSTLVAFYTKAFELNFKLNQYEMSFLDLLIKHKIVQKDSNGKLIEGHGVVISISRESSPKLRRSFMDHEASHAVFFQDTGYMNLASKIWDELEPEVKTFWKKHLAWRQYDISDTYLCINELQAYLVQQSLSNTVAYYKNVIKLLESKLNDPSITLHADKIINSAERDAKILNAYLLKNFGIGVGGFGRIREF